MSTVATQGQPIIIEQEVSAPDTTPKFLHVPQWVFVVEDTGDEGVPVSDLPSLDQLLGLDEEADNTPMPLVPNDALEAVSARLLQAAEALDQNEDRLAGRLQLDVLDRIDALLRQAQEQSQSGSPGETSGNPNASEQSATSEASGGASTAQQAQASQSGDGAGGMQQTIDPTLGGSITHHGDAWGTLPPRLRVMLEQGRRDATSMLYTDICAAYFRALLEAQSP
jgi:hypothetical protein